MPSPTAIHSRSRTARRTALITAAAALMLFAAPAGARTAYVTSEGDDGVQRVDLQTTPISLLGSPIATGTNPVSIAITPDGTRAYTQSIGSDTVSVINTATNALAAPNIAVTDATYVAITPDGARAYVSQSAQATVSVISTATNTVTGGTISMGGAGSAPSGIAITPDGSKAYVARTGADQVRVINLADNSVGPDITVGGGPQRLAVTPDGSRVYVTNSADDSVSVINTATDTVSTTITGTVNDPEGIAVTPDGARAYVAGNSSPFGVSVINLTNDTLVAGSVAAGNFPREIAVEPNGARAFVTSSGSNLLTPIDTATNAPGTALGMNIPGGVAIAPNQAPTAAFTSSPQPVGSAGAFNGSGSSDPDGSVARYDWDFGDGNTLPNGGPNPSHTYAAAGNYTVKLTVTDNEGCSKTLVFTGQTASCNGKPAAELSQQVSIPKLSPTLTTAASADVAIPNGQVQDTATLAGGHSPTGQIVFRLFGPDDANCSNPPVFTSTKNVASGNGSYGSDSFTPTVPGTYRWTAAYSGDANNEAATSPCNAAGETVTVNKATPTLTTNACCSVALGSAVIRDTATLSGGVSPTGEILFRLFGPDDASCSRPAVLTSTRPVNGAGSYDSDSFIPTVGGTYRWTAVYSGDANNASVTSPCNAPNESVTVEDPGPPQLTLGGKTAQKIDASVEVEAGCDEACAATGTGKLTVKGSGNGRSALAAKTFKLSAASVDVAAGDTGVLKFKLSRKARKAAAKAVDGGGKATAKVTVTATDASGNAATAKRTVKLTG
jgi:YVTN family beta-propeller protein